MKKLAGVAVIIFAAFAFFGWDGLNVPDEAPLVSVELREGFSGNSESARVWSGMLSALADFMEEDRSSSKPYIETMDDVASLISIAAKAPVKPVSGSEALAAYVTPRLKRIGGAGHKLSPTDKQSVISLLRDTSEQLGAIK